MSEAGSPPQPVARALARWSPALLALYGLGVWAVPLLEVPRAWQSVALSVVSWLLFTAIILAATAGLTAARTGRAVVLVVLIAAVGGWFYLAYGLGDKPPEPAQVTATVLVVVAMAALGRVLSWLFREANLLPPTLALAGVIDVWGVQQGVVAKVAEQNLETITKASAAVPAVASKAATAWPVASLSIGPGDIAVAALILAVVVEHGFDLRRNLVWMFCLTVAGLSLAMATPWLIPGLVFIGLAGVLANRDRFRYTADEKRALWAAGVIVAVVLAAGSLLAARLKGTG